MKRWSFDGRTHARERKRAWRRSLQPTAAALLVTAALLSTTAAGAQTLPSDLGTRHTGSDWPGFLGPTGDSKSSETGLRAPWPTDGPPIVWTRRVGDGYAIPSISRGRLFLFDAHAGRMRLVCLGSEDGHEIWSFDYPSDYEDMYGYDNGPRCCPVIDQNRVYILGPEGMLHCLQVVDGEQLWAVNTSERFHVQQNFFGVGSTPIVAGDLLLVQVGGNTPESDDAPFTDLVPNGTAIVALDKRSGEVRYATGDELASYASPLVTTIGDRRWGLLFARGGLLGFDPTNGHVEFHYPWRARILESVNASNPVVVGDQVFISETYGPGSSLLRVKPGGCEVVWRDGDGHVASADPSQRFRHIMQTHWNTSIHHDGYLYGSSGRHSNNAELRCVELATGKVMWSERGMARCSLLYVDGYFVCLGEYGELWLLRPNPEKFDVVSKAVPLTADEPRGRSARPEQLLKYPAWAAPILSHGLMYIRGRGTLACFELIPVADSPVAQ
ncbi:MAG: PQQ-binding-like beta-propeller repeat protein [Pirellulales bacterium]